MWICTNTGFVSIVADRENPTRLLVRARRQQDLKNFLPSFRHPDIFEDKYADYRWRAFVDRGEVQAIVSARLDCLDYDNFKNSVKDDELHDLYSDFWKLHWGYQLSDRAVKKAKKAVQTVKEVFSGR